MFPTAPPRFMPEWGFIDSVSDFTGMHIIARQRARLTALVNPYAAVPSMHVCVRADDRLAARAPGAPRIVSVLWLLYPFLMAFVIIATANHFIFDAVLGALTAGAVRLRRDAGSRGRDPRCWRFSERQLPSARSCADRRPAWRPTRPTS